MSQNFSFINNGKNESIDFSKLRDGLKKEDIAGNDKNIGSIFDSADTDSNKVLDKKELNVFQQAIKTIAKDNKISQQEAQEYTTKDNQKLGTANGKNLFKFLDKLNSTTKDIKSVQTKSIDGQEAEVTTFKDGHTETIFPDGSKILTSLKNGTKTETKLDKDGKKVKTTTTNPTKGTTTTEEFEGDNITKKTVEDYKTGTTKEYSQINGELKLSKKTDTKDNTITNYEYQDNKTIEHKEDSTGNKLSTTEIVEENGNKTVTKYDKDNHKVSQSYTNKDGKTQTAHYDESGNSKIVVQKGETAKDIAQKFGCSEQDLLNANNKKEGETFKSGETIIIPKTIDANDSNLANRKTTQEIAAEEKAEKAKEKAAIAELKYKKEMATPEGRKALFKKGPVYTDRVGNQYVLVQNAPAQGKGRVLAVNSNGEYCVVSHGKHFKTQADAQKDAKNSSVVLDNNYVVNTNLFTDKKNKKITINGKQYAITEDRRDGHARKYAVDAKGNKVVLSWNNKILKNDYVNKSDKIDIVSKDKGQAQKATADILNSQLKDATSAFNKQMDEDGWAGDFADGVSALWGSDNRASKVRVDLANYKREIADLQKAAKQGDKQYKAKFKTMFGVEYNAHNIAVYQQYPTEANYAKAFGTKNDIAARVAKYNQSQQTGAAVVKGVATVAAGIAVGVATGGTGLVAMAAATAATSFTINASDRITSHNGLSSEELGDIAKNSVVDGATVFAGGAIGEGLEVVVKGTTTTATVLRATGNAVANVGVGAGSEYLQTGHVTVEGTAINASMAVVGAASESGALKSVSNKIKGAFHKSEDVNIHGSSRGTETPTNLPDKTTSETPTSKEATTNETSKPKNTTSESIKNLQSKLGDKLYKVYHQIDSMIDNLKTVGECKSLKAIIEGKFANFKDEMKILLTKLENKAKSILSTDNNSKNKPIINEQPRNNTNEIIDDEFVRVKGNNGKAIDQKYIKTSKEVREYLNNEINNGEYTASFESYKNAINQSHEIAYRGNSGNDYWYMDKHKGGYLQMDAKSFHGCEGLRNNYVDKANMVQDIAQKYHDPYSTKDVSVVKLKGIEGNDLPLNIGTQHRYPPSKAMDSYYKEMYRTSQETLELIKKGASKKQILAKIAEHYQYAANARPYVQINNSLFMNEVNTLLSKAGMRTMPHGDLDHIAQRLQPEAFKKYFADEYEKTAL